MVEALIDEHRVDTIVHFAAESHVDRSILGPDDFIRTNVVGTHALLKAAKSCWLERKVGACSPLPSRLHGRGVWNAGSVRSAIPRIEPLRAEFSLFGQQQAGSDHPRAGLPRDVRT